MGGGLEHFPDVVGQGMAWAGRQNVCILENIHKRYYKSNFLICPHAWWATWNLKKTQMETCTSYKTQWNLNKNMERDGIAAEVTC